MKVSLNKILYISLQKNKNSIKTKTYPQYHSIEKNNYISLYSVNSKPGA